VPDQDEILAEVRARVPGVAGDEWVGLLRPAVGLTTGDGAGGTDGPVVGQLGGVPSLPDGMWWPEWDGIGPLSFGVSLDCAALSTFDTGVALPTDGTLLFFCYDRQIDFELFVSLDVPSTQAGARVVYLPAGTPVRPRATPEPLRAHPARALHARPTWSAVPSENPAARALLATVPDAERGAAWQAVTEAEAWFDAGRARHQVGGYPRTIQGDITSRVVGTKLGRLGADSPMWAMEARRWVTLLQVDSGGADEVPWGELGIVYWLIRREDLIAGAFGDAVMTSSFS